MKLVRPYRNVVVRRNGWLHRNRKPSLSCYRRLAGPAFLASWNGVLIRMSERTENT